MKPRSTGPWARTARLQMTSLRSGFESQWGRHQITAPTGKTAEISAARKPMSCALSMNPCGPGSRARRSRVRSPSGQLASFDMTETRVDHPPIVTELRL